MNFWHTSFFGCCSSAPILTERQRVIFSKHEVVSATWVDSWLTEIRTPAPDVEDMDISLDGNCRVEMILSVRSPEKSDHHRLDSNGVLAELISFCRICALPDLRAMISGFCRGLALPIIVWTSYLV